MPLQPVTFTLSTFGWESLSPLAPEVYFLPTRGGVQDNRLMPAQPVKATLTGSTGSVSLATTDTILPSGTGYTVRVSWLAGADVVPGARNWDTFPVPVFVLPGVTDLGEVIGRELGNDMVYVSRSAVNPNEYTGFQLDPVTGDLYKRVS